MAVPRFYKGLVYAYTALMVTLTVLFFVVRAYTADRAGLHRQVYPDVGLQGTALLDDVSSNVDLSFLDDDPALPRRFFSARWRGFWYLPEAATVELHGEGDDRLDVWIDDELVIRRTPPSDMHTQVAILPLSAGLHRIRAEYEQHAGAYAVGLQWAPQDARLRPLPPDYLFRERPDGNDIVLAQRAVLLRRTVFVLWGAPGVLALLWLASIAWTRHRVTTAAAPSGPHELARPNGLGIALVGVAYALATWVFVKNAWVTEDAYIVFRSVEQVFAGNGAVWNPHERVQVFTSPLWFSLLTFSRLISTDLYLNTIVISFGLWVITLRTLQRLAPSSVAFATGILLCVASTAIHDYTSSGLENVLAYALLAYFLLQFVRLHRDTVQTGRAVGTLGRLCIAFGLIVVTRHDLLLLVLPPAAYAVWTHRRLPSTRRWCFLAASALLPLAAWTLFAIVYYGFPWPNTAYAKLNTGIDRADLVVQGLRYLYVAVLHDAITPAIIGTALVLTCLRTRNAAYRFVGLGIVLNLIYVVSIGGDFMLGRFLSYSCLVGVIILMLDLPSMVLFPLWSNHDSEPPRAVLPWRQLDAAIVACVAVAAYAVAYQHTPLNCWRADREHTERLFGVENERDFYEGMTLANYVWRAPDNDIWPYNGLARSGLEIRNNTDLVHETFNIGLAGYMAGTAKIVVDFNALSDPLLARLPTQDTNYWRIGHFRRAIPDGYLKRLTATQDIDDDLREYGLPNDASRIDRLEFLSRMYPITPGELNELYRKLAIVTQADDLWSAERLKTILLFNLGAYDHLARPQH